MTHVKRADGALSAMKMPKGASPNFGVEVSVVGLDGKPIYAPDGKVLKTKMQMENGKFSNGMEQEFYFPEGHELAGQFKGMAMILEERGFQNAHKKKAQCRKKFTNCPEGATDCCCRRRLLPPSPKEEDLERNLVACLEEVSVITMRR